MKRITRKQAGVIYRNWKNGDITAERAAINAMYDLVDFCDPSSAYDAERMSNLVATVDHIFAGELDIANSIFEAFAIMSAEGC